MAKVGEGDPRWIVSDREDGKNVNAWHWEEKDLSKQAHDALKACFAGKVLCENPPVLSLTIKEVSEIGGEVTVAQRKGKIMCYFELHATIAWEGTADGSKVSGKLTIPEVDHDSFRDDFEIRVSAKERDSFHAAAETWLQGQGRTAVRQDIKAYFNKLFEEQRVGTYLKGQQPGSPAAPKAPVAAPSRATAPTSSGAPPTSFSLRMRWRAPVEDLFRALTDEQRMTMCMRAPASIDPRPSGLFSLLGGSITGYYVDVTFPTKLAMQWRLSGWPSQRHSSVAIVLAKEEPGVTLVDFAQQGIPEGEMERVRSGWLDHIFESMSKIFGWHMELL